MNTFSPVPEGPVAGLPDFEELYRKYYVFLCVVAEHIVRNKCDAEEIVSDVFLKLWNIREQVTINISARAYLVRAVRNTAYNYLVQHKTTTELTDSIDIMDIKALTWDDYPIGKLYEDEIIMLLKEGIGCLPVSCREIFLLSRDEDLRYHEIAERMGISVNTVKTQMKIALAFLRVRLKDYLTLAFFLLLNKI